MKMNGSLNQSFNAPTIKYPWDVTADKWEWCVLAVTRRGFPESVWTKPSNPSILKHINFLVSQLYCKRNFVACFCKYPYYLKDLYFYVAATWICTHELTAEIVSVEDIRESNSRFEADRRDTFEKTDLLILPYTDPENLNLKYTREPLGRIFQKRRIMKKATLIDIAMIKSDQRTKAGEKAMVNRISLLYGNQVSTAFGSETSKFVIVNPED